MKIALVLAGQLRAFNKGFEYLKKNILDEVDVDVYFHTWSKNWNRSVIEMYNPKAFIVEDDRIFGEFVGYRAATHPPKNFFMMYRSIFLADSIRKASRVQYDWIVRTRFDFALNTKIDFQSLDSTKMYFCDTNMNAEGTSVHDQFAIATPSDMDVYSSVYNNIEKYHSEGCVVNGEDLLIHHLKEHNMMGNTWISYLDLNPPFLHGRYNYGKHSLIREDMERWTH